MGKMKELFTYIQETSTSQEDEDLRIKKAGYAIINDKRNSDIENYDKRKF